MASIRDYINLVEMEGFNPPVFGRKGLPPDQPRPPQRRTSVLDQPREQRGVIAHAGQYANAEDYARANNPVKLLNTDPRHISDQYKAKHAELVKQWNNWKTQGYF